MRRIRSNRGLAHVGLLLTVVALVAVGSGVYIQQRAGHHQAVKEQQAETVRKQVQQAKQQQAATETNHTDRDQVLQALRTYCTSRYKSFWEGTYGKTIDPTTITYSYDDSVPNALVINGNYALISAAKCDTNQLTELQKFAPFALYLKKDAAWKAIERYQTTPPCQDFDGQGWPSDVLAQCSDNGVSRAVK